MPARCLTAEEVRLILAEFGDDEREIIAGWGLELGLDPDGPLRVAPTFFEQVAAMRIVTRLTGETPGLSRGEACRGAAELLGKEDGDQATHPGDNLARTNRRWIARERSRT
ncbi:MAG TPA: hypothetical protein VMM79_14355 [Longimicrobiales bacterium]|nr:hypothetical protein [Longimicrobiales bacterium]